MAKNRPDTGEADLDDSGREERVRASAPSAGPTLPTAGSPATRDRTDNFDTSPSRSPRALALGGGRQNGNGGPFPREPAVLASVAAGRPPAVRRSPLERLRSVILLGGSIRPCRITAATDLSVLDLPVERGCSLLGHWQRNVAELSRLIGIAPLSLRVLLDGAAPEPALPPADPAVEIQVERDLRSFRGTAGVLRDAAGGYCHDDTILVASAAQVLLSPLAELAWAMAATGSDICAVSHPDGTPSGMMLLRSGCLEVIPASGYLDMKEQGLSLISREHRGSVVYRRMPTGLRVRDLNDYIGALSLYHASLRAPDETTPFHEDGGSTFSIVEHGAHVAENARLHDAVVLRGGRVEAGAFVIRSIICGDGRITGEQTIVNEIVRS